LLIKELCLIGENSFFKNIKAACESGFFCVQVIFFASFYSANNICFEFLTLEILE